MKDIAYQQFIKDLKSSTQHINELIIPSLKDPKKFLIKKMECECFVANIY